MRRHVLEEEQAVFKVDVDLDCLFEKLASSWSSESSSARSSSHVDVEPLDCSSQLGRLGGCHAATGEVVDEHDGLPPRRWPWSVRLDLSEVGQGSQELDHAKHVLPLVVPDLYLAQVEEQFIKFRRYLYLSSSK